MGTKFFHIGGNLFMPRSYHSLRFVWRLNWQNEFKEHGFRKKTLFAYILAVLSLKRKKNPLKLPVKGTWCRLVRGGYKVFDIDRKRVAKVFIKGTDKEKIKKEVSLLIDVGQLKFAPSILDWDFDKGWYIEELVQGVSGYNLVPKESAEIIMERYFSFIEPTLIELIFSGSISSVNAFDYLSELKRENKKRQDIKEDGLLRAVAFVEKTSKRLSRNINCAKINITFCHGDFHQFNMLWTGKSLKLIDWEAALNLSILFDFYNFFFSQIYLENRNVDWHKAINDGFRHLQNVLNGRDIELFEHLCEYADIYRLIYYIERISTFIGVFQLDSNRINRWVEAFEKFEEGLTKKRFDVN